MKKIIYLLAIATLTLTSCDVNDPIHETAHPDKGKLTLTTDWTNCVETPASYTAQLGDKTAVLTGTVNVFPNLMPAGNYTLYVYNTADKITVSGTAATVGSIAGVVESLPGWFFSAAKDVAIAADTDHNITVPMVQQVREVNFTITPTGGSESKIASVTATLEGVTGTIALKTGAATGSTMSVTPLFTKQGNGDWTATIRLLDISGAVQTLTTKISFLGGIPANMEQSTVVTSQFANFGANKKTPLTLGATVVETPTNTGFSCTITDWTVGDNRPGTAD